MSIQFVLPLLNQRFLLYGSQNPSVERNYYFFLSLLSREQRQHTLCLLSVELKLQQWVAISLLRLRVLLAETEHAHYRLGLGAVDFCACSHRAEPPTLGHYHHSSEETLFSQTSCSFLLQTLRVVLLCRKMFTVQKTSLKPGDLIH